MLCTTCMGLTHVSCTSLSKERQKQITSPHPLEWTCNSCTIAELPFYKERDLLVTEKDQEQSFEPLLRDPHKSLLESKSNSLKFMHLNTQSMRSTFDEFQVLVHTYPFDIITLSETWLNDNQHLIDYVQIPGYVIRYRNRLKVGGGVGVYIKENIKFKVRTDLINLDPQLEHLWIEVEGKNKHSHLLIGIFYQSYFSNTEKLSWFEKFDHLLVQASASWSGQLIITGDFNIDLPNPNSQVARTYLDILESHNLTQHITKPTRKGKSLIDHIVTNRFTKIQASDVLPTPEISDHDAVYACINVRSNNFEPRYKFIRDNSKFSMDEFIADFSALPMSLVYAFDDPGDQLDIFNK